jgi:hypothetical protein
MTAHYTFLYKAHLRPGAQQRYAPFPYFNLQHFTDYFIVTHADHLRGHFLSQMPGSLPHFGHAQFQAIESDGSNADFQAGGQLIVG